MYKLKNIYHECQTIQKYKTDVLSQINRITGKYVLGYKYTVKSPTGKKLWEQAWRWNGSNALSHISFWVDICLSK